MLTDVSGERESRACTTLFFPDWVSKSCDCLTDLSLMSRYQIWVETAFLPWTCCVESTAKQTIVPLAPQTPGDIVRYSLADGRDSFLCSSTAQRLTFDAKTSGFATRTSEL